MEQIDILMATYNGEKYIKMQIESILKQTYSNFRLIISDDCSTDKTVDILKEYENKDERIKVYYQNENLGCVRNFEFLLGKVENNLYALSDQDDIWLPEKIEKCLDNMKTNDSDLVFGDLRLIDEKDNIISNSFWRNKGFYKKIKKDVNCKGLLLNNYVTGCTILSKKSFLKDILPLPDNTKYLIHDYWIAIVVCLKGKISYVEEPLILYRQHSDNQVGYKTKSKELDSFEDVRKLFIDVKIEHFKIFQQKKELFSDIQQRENKVVLEYYEMLKGKRFVNFRKWRLFYKLYRFENFKYFLGNFVVLNFPVIGKFLKKFFV